MKIDAAFQGLRSIYIDTPPLIYLVERNPDYFESMYRISDFIGSARLQVFTSVITLTEILAQPLRLGNSDLAREYLDILVTRDECIVVEISTALAIKAAEIRARYSLRTPDALHAASALLQRCDAFLTNDSDFRRVQDLNVLVLDDLEL